VFEREREESRLLPFSHSAISFYVRLCWENCQFAQLSNFRCSAQKEKHSNEATVLEKSYIGQIVRFIARSFNFIYYKNKTNERKNAQEGRTHIKHIYTQAKHLYKCNIFVKLQRSLYSTAHTSLRNFSYSTAHSPRSTPQNTSKWWLRRDSVCNWMWVSVRPCMYETYTYIRMQKSKATHHARQHICMFCNVERK